MDDHRTTFIKSRLDAFVDAAFAFAVTLLVIGGGSVPETFADLRASAMGAPAFAVGFALIATFWYGHVRWRAAGTAAGPLPVMLSLLLVFLVLLYVYPLRLMAASLVAYFGGVGELAPVEDAVSLFALYGAGFTAMSACVAMLFATSLRRPLAPPDRAQLIGEVAIWSILALTGLASALLSLIPSPLAPWAYATLPVTIGLFSWRYDWDGRRYEAAA